MGQPQATVKSQPLGRLELVFQEGALQLTSDDRTLSQRTFRQPVRNVKQRVVALDESLHPKMSIVSSLHYRQADHATGVVGAAVIFRAHRQVQRPADVISAVEVIER